MSSEPLAVSCQQRHIRTYRAGFWRCVGWNDAGARLVLRDFSLVRDFRGLDVWRKAHALMLNVRRATRDFHRARSASLRSQITRSSEAIPNNIVEGCFAATQKEFARYLDISIKSSGETEYELQQARDRGLLGARDWRALSEQTIEVRKMAIALPKKILRDLLEDQDDRAEGASRLTSYVQYRRC